MQSTIVESQWEQIKSPAGKQRVSFGSVDWDKFDLLKYARDCFAHNWDGQIFPSSQNNTRHFHTIMSRSTQTFLSLDFGKIILSDRATFECLQVIDSIIKEGTIVV